MEIRRNWVIEGSGDSCTVVVKASGLIQVGMIQVKDVEELRLLAGALEVVAGALDTEQQLAANTTHKLEFSVS